MVTIAVTSTIAVMAAMALTGMEVRIIFLVVYKLPSCSNHLLYLRYHFLLMAAITVTTNITLLATMVMIEVVRTPLILDSATATAIGTSIRKFLF